MVEYKEGQTIDVTIQSVGKKGDGIVKIENKLLFVSDVSEGETLTVTIQKVLPHVVFAIKS